ncbi:MAG: OmpA family protein [Thiomicrorhabdus sp.]|nr:OmpA family protein [Thiomicrorhabdus sp.]
MKYKISNLILMMVFLFTASLSVTVFSKPVASMIITHGGIKGTLFNREHRTLERYDLIVGSMLYQEEDNDFYSKGYRPGDTKVIEGAVVREIYDYPVQLSSVGLYRRLVASLHRQKYTELYHCERALCGEVAGWGLYLGSDVVGESHTQYYLAYSKSVGNQVQYVSAYINQVDNEARLIIERVSFPSRTVGVNIHLTELNPPIVYPKIKGDKILDVSILYANNAKKPSKNMLGLLAEFASYINANPVKNFAVVGHSDDQASAQYNLELSLKRAKHLQKILINQYNVDANRLKAYGLGESRPFVSNKTREGREKNRRVELFQLQP